jgi:lipoate-protein ligase A
MSGAVRVVDAGLRDGRYNIALDQAMLDLHQSGAIGDSLRFIHFPPVVLVGRHQALSAEVDLHYCRAHGIAVGRRITGGGAIYLDSGQLGWALVFNRHTLRGGALEQVARAICEAVAAGLSRLGIDVRYRPRNDLEVDGRKISGTGGFYDGDTLIYQGTVLVDLDPHVMFGALRVPRGKLAKRELDRPERRVVTLRELLGSATPPTVVIEAALLRGFEERLGLIFQRAELSVAELQLAARLYATQVGRDEFVSEIDVPQGAAPTQVGSHTSPGGTITTYLRREGAVGQRIAQVLITGDFFVSPPRFVYDLECCLRGTEVAALVETLHGFFAARKPDVLSVAAEDFLRSLQAALAAPAVPVNA